VDVNFEEEMRVMLILCFLPNSWDSVIMTINNSVSGRRGSNDKKKESMLKYDDVAAHFPMKI